MTTSVLPAHDPSQCFPRCSAKISRSEQHNTGQITAHDGVTDCGVSDGLRDPMAAVLRMSVRPSVESRCDQDLAMIARVTVPSGHSTKDAQKPPPSILFFLPTKSSTDSNGTLAATQRTANSHCSLFAQCTLESHRQRTFAPLKSHTHTNAIIGTDPCCTRCHV